MTAFGSLRANLEESLGSPRCGSTPLGEAEFAETTLACYSVVGRLRDLQDKADTTTRLFSGIRLYFSGFWDPILLPGTTIKPQKVFPFFPRGYSTT